MQGRPTTVQRQRAGRRYRASLGTMACRRPRTHRWTRHRRAWPAPAAGTRPARATIRSSGGWDGRRSNPRLLQGAARWTAPGRAGFRASSLEARLLALRARGHAATGNSAACTDDLRRAERVLVSTPADAGSPWASSYDGASLAVDTARCLPHVVMNALIRASAAGSRTQPRLGAADPGVDPHRPASPGGSVRGRPAGARCDDGTRLGPGVPATGGSPTGSNRTGAADRWMTSCGVCARS